MMNNPITTKPILITGTFRSGTTLVSQVLNSHSKLAITYDSVNFLRFSYQKYDPITNPSNFRKLLVEIEQRITKRWGLAFDINKVLNNCSKGGITYATIYDALMNELLLSDQSAIHWGEKTTLVWTKIPDFLEMFPMGVTIHVIRDPRAVLASWKNMTNAPGNDYLDAIFNCLDSMNKALQFQDKYNKSQHVIVKYEDLALEPEKTVKELCLGLNIEFEPQMLDTQQFKNKKGEVWSGNSIFESKINGFSSSSINKWKTQLQDWELLITQFCLEEVMNSFSYELVDQLRKPELIDRAIFEIEKSNLAANGIIQNFFHKRGVERFPSDPLKSNKWQDELG